MVLGCLLVKRRLHLLCACGSVQRLQPEPRPTSSGAPPVLSANTLLILAPVRLLHLLCQALPSSHPDPLPPCCRKGL